MYSESFIDPSLLSSKTSAVSVATAPSPHPRSLIGRRTFGTDRSRRWSAHGLCTTAPTTPTLPPPPKNLPRPSACQAAGSNHTPPPQLSPRAPLLLWNQQSCNGSAPGPLSPQRGYSECLFPHSGLCCVSRGRPCGVPLSLSRPPRSPPVSAATRDAGGGRGEG